MATREELQRKLQDKLRELFQLDQPDLDFGFYRVMHAKAKRIDQYLNADLPNKITAAFAGSNSTKMQADFDAAKTALVNGLGESAIDDDGNVNHAFSAVPLVQQYIAAKTALESAKTNADAEADVYDHLYHFFERYYDKGDFVSLRYLTRETDHKAMPYAIPYAGEEVKLHWANADQYYIKTSENFSHFSFDAAQHPAVLKMDTMAKMAAKVPESLKVHFEIVDADEGEHGNIKQGKERFFILHDAKKCEVKDGEVYVYYEYRDDPEMTGQAAKWQEKRRTDALSVLKTELVAAGLSADVVNFLYLDLNNGDKKKGEKILLDVYLKRYMARNTSDYFIHKDLGGFLRRELDFYIKNDLMILDDVTAATPETVVKWLGKTKVFREIALDIIAFLAQLEDFQKKLWLKKKFVVECEYCITLDRIPKELHAEVLGNQKQIDEWKRLGIDADPKATDMMAIDARMVDTRFFDDAFKQKLLASIDDFDAQCDGVLIHSDNFQGLKFIMECEREQVNSIYADPPYNADATCILYKNGYRHSSWDSLIYDRLIVGRDLMSKSGISCTTIDDYELYNLKIILDQCYGADNFLANVVIRNNPSGRSTVAGFAICHEYGLFYSRDNQHSEIARLAHTDAQRDRYNQVSEDGKPYEWENLRKSSAGSYHEDRPKQFFPIYYSKSANKVRVPECVWCEQKGVYEVTDSVKGDEVEVLPIDGKGRERVWGFGIERVRCESDEIIAKEIDGKIELYKKKYLQEKGVLPRTWWDKAEYSARDNGSRTIANLFGSNRWFDFPKAVEAVKDALRISSIGKNGVALDYFGGSGTTAHAVIDLNRQDKGTRKYILIEMGDHFDTVLKPRIEKVVYSPDWKDGKPEVTNKGVSHCFKYLRLESYEDALNNLVVDEEKGKAFAEIGDYFFKYMLDVETKGSPSLLNVKEFANPFGYKLIVKKPASEEREEKTVDLVETFNYLVGLRVKKMQAVKSFAAEFERKKDPELPEDQHTKLTVKGNIKLDTSGPWQFRLVEGWCPKNRFTPNDGAKENVLVVWRNLTGDIEKDNAVLDAFLQRSDINALDGEFDVIYVNGSNNVPNLRKDGDTWKVQPIEETFLARMWEGL